MRLRVIWNTTWFGGRETLFGFFGHSDFEFVSDFEFRISDLFPLVVDPAFAAPESEGG